ncbi:MAG: FCD domain-containing protein [Armatimonadetes bacterium]|nr:FCD domain-containing protein [Armatimonadota bacterium]
MIETVRAQLSYVRMLTVGARGRATKSFREMAKLIAALRARDGARAEVAMREHVASLRLDAAGVVSPVEEDQTGAAPPPA